MARANPVHTLALRRSRIGPSFTRRILGAAAAMTRRFARALAGALMGVMLFAQFTVAAYACPGLDATQVVGAEAAGAPALGCDDMAGAMDPAAPNLCAEHCKVGQQSDQAAATLSVPTAVLAVLYATPVVLLKPPPPQPMAAPISALVAAAPPRTIAHCVYRI